MVTYLGERNIAIFSTDMDSFDFKLRKPEQIIKAVMTKLKKHGKGMVLMHDFQAGTAQAVPQLLAELKAGGYKIVHMKPKNAISHAAAIRRGAGQGVRSSRPSASVRPRAWCKHGRLTAARMSWRGAAPQGRPFAFAALRMCAAIRTGVRVSCG